MTRVFDWKEINFSRVSQSWGTKDSKGALAFWLCRYSNSFFFLTPSLLSSENIQTKSFILVENRSIETLFNLFFAPKYQQSDNAQQVFSFFFNSVFRIKLLHNSKLNFFHQGPNQNLFQPKKILHFETHCLCSLCWSFHNWEATRNCP